MSDLVARLRKRADVRNNRLVGLGDGSTYVLSYYDAAAAKDDREAADLIEQQAAKIAELEEWLSTEIRGSMTAFKMYLDARDSALEEAAKVFDKHGETYSGETYSASIGIAAAIRSLKSDAGRSALAEEGGKP